MVINFRCPRTELHNEFSAKKNQLAFIYTHVHKQYSLLVHIHNYTKNKINNSNDKMNKI